AHAPQHFLYFLPLPHGHRSFLPVFGVSLLIREEVAAVFSVDSAEVWLSFFAPFRPSFRKHAHQPISATVSSTRRRWGWCASLARMRSLPMAKSRLTRWKPM